MRAEFISPPPPHPSPRTSCAPLDARAVEAAASANAHHIVIATFANHAQLDFALNWHAHLDALHLGESALMGATDAPTASGLAAAGVRCFPLSSSIGAAEAKWGSPGFTQMGRSKAWLLRELLTLGATVLFADADVAFLRDPLPYLARQLRHGAAMLFHTDAFGASPEAVRATEPEALERPTWSFHHELNTGLFVATPNATAIARAWCDVLQADSAFANWRNDQQSLNELVRKGAAPARHDAATRIFPGGAGGSLGVGILPSHLFPSGHVYFIQRQLRQLRGVTPYAVHLTFQNCDQYLREDLNPRLLRVL